MFASDWLKFNLKDYRPAIEYLVFCWMKGHLDINLMAILLYEAITSISSVCSCETWVVSWSKTMLSLTGIFHKVIWFAEPSLSLSLSPSVGASSDSVAQIGAPACFLQRRAQEAIFKHESGSNVATETDQRNGGSSTHWRSTPRHPLIPPRPPPPASISNTGT